MNGTRTPSPPPGRSIDIELSGQEIISVDLDSLDPRPDDLLDVLKESKSQVWIWTRLAGEYWRQGYLDAAEQLAHGAIESFQSNGSTSSLPPIYSLLANLQIAHARNTPKLILSDARQDDMRREKPRDDFYRDAASYVNQGERAVTESGENMGTTLSFLTRAILQLGNRSMDDAMRSFDGVLAEKPTNVVALLGKARILYARRQYSQALRIFQEVLKLNPACDPDPRIGIGLCLWAMDHKDRAKAAWQRSLEVNPNQWPAQLLLGLEAFNSSKNANQTDEERKRNFVVGTKLIESAFRANQKNSAAANALCELLLRKGQYKKALKLAERTIQFADTLTVLTDGYIRAGRVLHAERSTAEAMNYYTKAKEGQPSNVLASIGLAQVQIESADLPAALHTLDTLLQPPNTNRSTEATVMLAAIRAHARPGVSSSEQGQEKLRARELFDRVCKSLNLPTDNVSQANGHHSLTPTQRRIADDVEMHTEIARLWQAEDLDRTERALTEAIRLSQISGQVNPRLVNNLGALHHLQGRLDQARTMYETALTSASALEPDVGESMSTSILYNLGRVYEDQGEDPMAQTAYDKLLARHPEYIDAKIRQAQMLMNLNKPNEAHDLLKQALASQNSNLNLRSFYTHFLIQSGLPKPAKEMVFTTLRDHDKHDIYSLCAAGWIQYYQARESRDASSKGVEERRRGFQRSAEFYEKALHLDPLCAVAAQGLAIVVAEDALGTLGGTLAPPAPDDAQRRVKNAREALDIFAKVRESLNDGSVYSNMGHCYYASDEFDRAIESYETASKRFYNGHNVPVLLCLCRAWYAKAMKDQSYTSMNTALRYAQTAFHLSPHGKDILYNIAMIQQKAAEMLFSVPVAKRSLKDLQRAIAQAQQAQKLFASLAADKSSVPYSKDLADQRRKYGDSVLRRCDEHLATQRQHENEIQAKLDAARRKRQEEKETREARERERMEELRVQAEKLAEERRIARAKALEWTQEVKNESDEEKEKKVKKALSRKVKAEAGVSGDEGEPREPPKKKRKGKLKKNVDAEEDGALFSNEEEVGGGGGGGGEKEKDKPSRKRTKKRVVRDDDDEGEPAAPRKKQIKSKEYISDSDEEMS